MVLVVIVVPKSPTSSLQSSHLVVPYPDTVVHPRAVMVHFYYTPVADAAVVGPGRFERLGAAPSASPVRNLGLGLDCLLLVPFPFGVRSSVTIPVPPLYAAAGV